MGGRVRGRVGMCGGYSGNGRACVRVSACIGGHGGTTRSRPYGKALRIFYKNFRLPRSSLRSLATSSYLSYTIFIMLWRCLKISFLLIAVAYIACVGDLCRRMIFDLRYGWTPAWHRFRRDFIALNASWVAVGRWIIHKTTSLMSRLR